MAKSKAKVLRNVVFNWDIYEVRSDASCYTVYEQGKPNRKVTWVHPTYHKSLAAAIRNLIDRAFRREAPTAHGELQKALELLEQISHNICEAVTNFHEKALNVANKSKTK